MSKEIRRCELIGAHVKITDSKNSSLIGFEGRIVDETKNMLIIQGKTQKSIIKNQVKMKMRFNNKSIVIDGRELVGRPTERLKK